ncbi:uroporphyrinogen-III synthase [Thalassotalea crassostreae]|uniref:uroporphyrinogen-III synthase n=1 Tax=Thalassotalea crassostreae TaxID=1763536 RepID=UPI00083838B2|nr:uroporphyrinogen-III synthase [Thalassotalea crassostreae]
MSKNNRNILLTRPKDKSDELAKVLAPIADHIDITPLFNYRQGPQFSILSDQLRQLSPDFVIFISPAAVRFASQHFDSNEEMQRCFSKCKIITVGSATKLVLQEYLSQPITVPTTHNSEGILALPEFQQVEQKSILIIRGNGGRELLKQELQHRGAIVAYNEVYERNWLSLNKSQTIEKWRKDNINFIVITSGELFDKTLSYIDDMNWANRCTWIVASKRIAEQAKAYGLTKVINAEGASHQQILKAID